MVSRIELFSIECCKTNTKLSQSQPVVKPKPKKCLITFVTVQLNSNSALIIKSYFRIQSNEPRWLLMGGGRLQELKLSFSH